MAVRSRFLPLPRLAFAIERDRHERDKVLTYAGNLERITYELRTVLAVLEGRDDYLTRDEALTLLRSIVGDE